MADDSLSKDEQFEIACLLLDRREEGAVRLLAAYGGRVKWLLKRKLGDFLTDHDLKSVLNLAVAKAVNAAATFNDTHTLGGWFYTIAHHAAIDTLREQPTSPENGEILPLEIEPSIAGRTPASIDDPPPDDPLIADLLQVIDELGPAQKLVAKADLLVGGEADAEVLAAKLGLSKSHVYSYRNKYRESIRKRMERRGHTAETIGRRK